MATHRYRFLSHWRVESTPEEVFEIIDDTSQYVRWWPAVWLRAEVLDPGDAQGMGRVTRWTSKGWLPYILHWTSRTVEKEFPRRIALEAVGDFEGRGLWEFAADDRCVDLTYHWEIDAQKPLLRYGSFLMRPLFAANHRWAMARGEESLVLELKRKGAESEAERARIPTPPPPVFLSQRRRRSIQAT